MKTKSILIDENIHTQARLYCREKGLIFKGFIEKLIEKELKTIGKYNIIHNNIQKDIIMEINNPNGFTETHTNPKNPDGLIKKQPETTPLVLDMFSKEAQDAAGEVFNKLFNK
jgi:hypothetical protein